MKVGDIDISVAIDAAYAAGAAIMKIYESADFGVEMKSDDSPLTLADKAAHVEIVKYLETTSWPILSEEGNQASYEDRSKWDTFWMVDPLDGTKEFIKRNGEFTVNIALIQNGTPVFGVVYSPVLKKMYYGGKALSFSEYSFDKESPIRLMQKMNDSVASLVKKKKVKIIASRSHQNRSTTDFISQFYNPEIITMGSSLKFLLLAEGEASIYPRFSPCMEWDTAAAHAVLEGVGGNIYQLDKQQKITDKPLIYNKIDLQNPYFIAI